MSLERQVLQEQGIHRALEAHVHRRDLALGPGDDTHAREADALEEAGDILLVT
jgi:hypothetical protein